MKNINEEALHWVQALLLLSIWMLFSLLSGEHEISLGLLKELPHVVTVYAVLAVIFVKWGWRLRVFRGWLVPLPDLSGIWVGELRSTWLDPVTNHPATPIAARLHVQQSFSSIACTLRTEESESESTAAHLSRVDGSDAVRLYYTYSNRPKAGVRPRSEMHDGASVLTLLVKEGQPPVLEGQYWTSRKTTGDMTFSQSPEIATG